MNKTKLAVFDFDGTLANVPEKPMPNQPHHGWNGRDWWGSEASLTPPLYNGEMHDEIVDAFRKAKADPATQAIVLTGRRGVISHRVRDILRQNKLFGKRIIADTNKDEHEYFQNAVKSGKDMVHPNESLPDAHHEYFTGDFFTEPDYPRNSKGKIDSGTWTHKMYVVDKLMNDNILEVDFWDDRDEHIPNWKKLGVMYLKKFLNLQRVALHRVYNFEGMPPVVEHIPIKKDTQW